MHENFVKICLVSILYAELIEKCHLKNSVIYNSINKTTKNCYTVSYYYSQTYSFEITQNALMLSTI